MRVSSRRLREMLPPVKVFARMTFSMLNTAWPQMPLKLDGSHARHWLGNGYTRLA